MERGRDLGQSCTRLPRRPLQQSSHGKGSATTSMAHGLGTAPSSISASSLGLLCFSFPAGQDENSLAQLFLIEDINSITV